MEDKRLSRRIDFYYAAMQFTAFASSFVIFLYISVILQEKGFTNSEIGLTLALGSGLSIVLPPLIAMYYTRHTHLPLRRITAYVRIITFVFLLLLLVVHSPVALVSVIVIIISGTSISATPLVSALAMQFENIGVAVNFGKARAFGSLGCAVMAYASGQLSTHFGGSAAVVLVSLLLMAASALFTLFFPVPQNANSSHAPLPVSREIGFKLLKQPANMLFFLVMVLIWANTGILDTYQINILQLWGGNEMNFGVMLMVMTLSEIPLALLFRPLSKRFSYTQLMIAGFLGLLLKDISLLLSSSVAAVIAAQCFNLVTIVLITSACVYYINGCTASEQTVQAQALFGGTAMAIGRIVGNLIAGAILDGAAAESAGIKTMLLVCIGFALMSLVLMRTSCRLRNKMPSALPEATV